MQELKCPNCKGNKYTMIADNTFLCAYCGATFQGPKSTLPQQQPQPQQPPQQQPQIIQYVYNQQAPQKQPKKNTGWCSWFIIVIAILFLISALGLL